MAAELLNLIKNLAIQRGVGSLEKRINQFYSDSDDTNQFTSNQRDMGLKSILGRTAAFGLLGPILGPIAFALGKGIMGRRNRMSLTDDSIITPGPTKTGGGDPNQIQMQEPTTSQGQAIDPSDLVSITDNKITTHVSNADLQIDTDGTGFIDILTDTQSTVGSAGGASALPGQPTGYIKIKIGGTLRVIPFYDQA